MRVLAVALAAALFMFGTTTAAPTVTGNADVVIKNTHPLIHHNGRWDKSPGTWWAGSGFKIRVQDLKELKLKLGEHTTAPLVSLGVSVNYEPFFQVNASEGTNVIPLSNKSVMENTMLPSKPSVVRINVEGWQNNRMNLEEIILNPGAKLLKYTPSKLAFQFIGDSLSAVSVGSGSQGQFLPEGVDQAWTFLTGENFKAEHNVNAQPGAALKDIVSYGNQHGVSYQYFKTEDTGYYYTPDHNYTTPWNFARDQPEPTHIVIHIGANDASQNVTADDFVETYLSFLQRLRKLYLFQPIFIFTPWGWPAADGTVSYYYEGQYQRIVNTRVQSGDIRTYLVDTTGWVTWDDVFPDNTHPNVAGHAKIANLFSKWLEAWGLLPLDSWSTPLSPS
ncbi:SGNH hydrolase [Epithele typhae]|uniref:SGNH hydrolase n=1 Tax=Epithele typhae TaxID=378194 RepID=UPI0020089E28|nr:SGNH hydrolase [Epithele typhae]KAH9910208.1 SGNH hydrolase [Epithele typhae]